MTLKSLISRCLPSKLGESGIVLHRWWLESSRLGIFPDLRSWKETWGEDHCGHGSLAGYSALLSLCLHASYYKQHYSDVGSKAYGCFADN